MDTQISIRAWVAIASAVALAGLPAAARAQATGTLVPGSEVALYSTGARLFIGKAAGAGTTKLIPLSSAYLAAPPTEARLTVVDAGPGRIKLTRDGLYLKRDAGSNRFDRWGVVSEATVFAVAYDRGQVMLTDTSVMAGGVTMTSATAGAAQLPIDTWMCVEGFSVPVRNRGGTQVECPVAAEGSSVCAVATGSECPAPYRGPNVYARPVPAWSKACRGSDYDDATGWCARACTALACARGGELTAPTPAGWLLVHAPDLPGTTALAARFQFVVTKDAPMPTLRPAAASVLSPPSGWQISIGQPGKPAVLLVHGLAASSLHFTEPKKAWNVARTHYDHDRPVTAATGRSELPQLGLLALEGSPDDPQSDRDGSLWAYLVREGFTVATWDQAPCIEATAIPTSACLDSDTFDVAKTSGEAALKYLASVTTGDLALVGHSRGGLVARHLLKPGVVPAAVRDRIKTLVTIHTPHHGTSISGKGAALEAKLAGLSSLAGSSATPEVARAAIEQALAVPAGMLDALKTQVGLTNAAELAPGSALYAGLEAGESRPAGLKVYTFGGTSVTVWRLHAWVFTAASATPASGYRADPIEVVRLPDALGAAFDEMTPGVGDLLVTDASSHLPGEDGHVTHALNHGEVLWSHAVHREVHERLLGITLPPAPAQAPYAPAVTGSVGELVAELKKVPPLDQLIATAGELTGGAYPITLRDPRATIQPVAFRGHAGWHVAVTVDDAALVDLGELKAHLGLPGLSATLVVSTTAERLRPDELPEAVQAAIGAHARDGVVELAAGANLFATATPSGDGVLGYLTAKLGMGAGAVRISGAVGAALVTAALTATPAAASPTFDLQVVLPPLTPLPFDKKALRLELGESVLHVEKRAGAALTLAAQLRGTLWVASKPIQLASGLAYTPATRTVRVTGEVAAPFDPFALGLPIESFAVAGEHTPGGTSTFAVSAKVKLRSSTVTGTFGVETATSAGKTTVKGVSLALAGGLTVADLGLADVPVLGDLVLRQAALGFSPNARQGYVTGEIEWPGHLTATGVIVGVDRPGAQGFALFASARDVELARVLGLSAGGPELPFPDLTLVVSTVDLTRLKASDLPPSAQDLLGSLPTTTMLPFGAGVALVAALPLDRPALAPIAAQLGVAGSLTVIGAVSGLASGRPSFTLEVAAPTFTLPDPIARLVESATPKLFLGLAQTGLGPELSVGLAGDFKLARAPFGVAATDPNLVLRGKLYGVVGASGVGAKMTGQLVGEWKDPFGLDGLTIGDATRPTTISVGATANLAFDLGVGGAVKLARTGKPAVSFAAAGLVRAQITPAFGIPVITGIALELEASELAPLVPLEVGQTLLRSVAARARTAGLTIPGVSAATLDAVKSYDLAARVERAVPLAQVKLTDVGLFVATPGMSHPDFPSFSGFGVKARGKLWYGATEVGALDGKVEPSGFALKSTGPKDLTLGPLVLRQATLDIGAELAPSSSPRFALAGDVSLFGAGARVAVAIDMTGFKADFGLTLGKLDLVQVGLKSEGTTIPTDLRLTLVVEPQRLVDDVAQGVRTLLDRGPGAAMRAEAQKAKDLIRAQEAAYDGALRDAEADRAKAMAAVDRARADVTAVRIRRDALAGERSTAKSALDSALLRLDIPEVAKQAGNVARLDIELGAIAGLVASAEATLNLASSGVTWFPVRSHPKVLLAQGDLNAARASLAIVQVGIAGLSDVQAVVTTLQNGVSGVNPLVSFKLIDASLAAALAGTPQQFEVKLKLAGPGGAITTLTPSFDLRNPSLITLDAVTQPIFRDHGGIPDPARIAAAVAQLDLGYGDVRFFKDLKRDGTNSASDWIADQPIGAPGLSELVFLLGGHGGRIYGVTWDQRFVKLTDTARNGTAAWTGPVKLRDLDWKPLRDVFGGWDGYVGVMNGGLNWTRYEVGNSPIYNISGSRPFDTSASARQRGRWAQVFGGHQHVFYAIEWNGDLYCTRFRIDPATNLPKNPDGDGGDAPYQTKIGTGWNRFTHVFGGEDGRIYAVERNGDLKFYKHAGRDTCTSSWTTSDALVAHGFDRFRQVIGGEDGIIYAVPYQAKGLEPGRELGLYDLSAQRFLRSTAAGVDASDIVRSAGLRPPQWTWETWEVVDAGNGKIALWSPAWNKFLRMNDQGDLDLSGGVAKTALPAGWAWERFTPEQVGPGRYRLFSDAHQRYVAFKDDTDAASTGSDVTTAPKVGPPAWATTLRNGYTSDVFEVMPVR